MGSPLGYLGRWCDTGSMALDGEGGSGCRDLAGVRCSGPGVAYSVEDLAQKNREVLEVLTEAWSGRGVTQVAPATRVVSKPYRL